MLMNEADQLLSRRSTESSQAIEKEGNRAKNVLLDFVENFRGVLIATTNLRGLLDPAWDRRFLIKIFFGMPPCEERVKLWRIHLRSTLPLAEDVNIEDLSEYELTGGEIGIVVKNAVIKAFLRDAPCVTQQDFLEAIDREIETIRPNKRNIGF